ncbi:MAG: hypothetical protein WBB76_06375, partial [Gaiellaceae bacterium]
PMTKPVSYPDFVHRWPTLSAYQRWSLTRTAERLQQFGNAPTVVAMLKEWHPGIEQRSGDDWRDFLHRVHELGRLKREKRPLFDQILGGGLCDCGCAEPLRLFPFRPTRRFHTGACEDKARRSRAGKTAGSRSERRQP